MRSVLEDLTVLTLPHDPRRNCEGETEVKVTLGESIDDIRGRSLDDQYWKTSQFSLSRSNPDEIMKVR